MATSDNLRVITRVKGVVVTQGRLSAAFDKVADKKHWKNPIDTTVECDDLEKEIIYEAVIHFTGSVPEFVVLPGRHRGQKRKYRIKADGYYLAIGA